MASPREARLLDILACESSKLGAMTCRAPAAADAAAAAVFRSTALDTHATSPAEDFGPAYQNASATALQYGSSTICANTSAKTSKGRTRRSATAGQQLELQQQQQQAVVEFRSVFRPKPEQEEACAAACTRRSLVAGSEWALLDTLEVSLLLSDKEQHAARHKEAQARQRAALDQQARANAQMKAAEVASRKAEQQVLEQEVVRYKAEEAAKEQQVRQCNMALKQEREAMLVTARAAKAEAAASRKAAEARELEAAQKQWEYERTAAKERCNAVKAAAQALRAQNEVRIAGAKKETARQKAIDEALMQQTLEALGKQEAQREAKLAEFMASVAARADRAGQRAVVEKHERLEQELVLLAQAEAQKEAAYLAREAAAADKKARMAAELAAGRAAQLADKQAQAARAKAEKEAERHAAEVSAVAHRQVHEAKMAGGRARGKEHQQHLRMQMAARGGAAIEDDTRMSPRERQLNSRLVQQAQCIVGQPKQLSTINLF